MHAVVILLSLSAAVFWGSSDFLAGTLARRLNVYVVIAFSHFISIWALILMALLVQEPFPSGSDLAFGLLSGASSFIGGLALYLGFRAGHMGVVAPVSGVIAALIPVVLSLFTEGLPSQVQLAGFGFGMLGIYWLSSSPGAPGRMRLHSLAYPLASGIGFGMLFVFTDLYSARAIYWPVAAGRLASMSLAFLAGRYFQQPMRAAGGNLPLLALAGLLGIAGNVVFALATRFGRLDIASVLGSLYPAVTVVLAWLLIGERLSSWQWAGAAAAMLAVVLIAL